MRLQSTSFRLRLAPALLIGMVSVSSGGCDFFNDDEAPPLPSSVAISFRIEANRPPVGGWVYWYVDQGVFHRKPGANHGPVGARADCGSHAGMAALVETGEGTDEPLTLVIETIVDDPDSAAVARETFSGDGEHVLAVLVTCP